MSRFRYFGLNWEGRRWSASDPVVTFGNQISVLYPAAGTADGTVASRAHDAASPNSDHRPTPHSGLGIVRAIDVGADTPEERAIPEILRKSRDARIRYVIFGGRIFTDDTWEWEEYNGANPHNLHYHVSFNASADDDGTPFELTEGGDDMALTPKEENTVRDLLAALEANGAGTQAGRQSLLDKTFKIANNYPATPAPGDGGGLKRGDSVVLS